MRVLLAAIFVLASLTTAQAKGVCPDGRININTATPGELTALKGVGKKKAAKIVADRAKNGPFANRGALARVKGIGLKSVAKWNAQITTDCAAPAGAAAAEPAPAPSAKIDLNTATAAELTAVKGIGKKMAAKIVALRTKKKKFKTIDELAEVKGIGKAKIAKMKAILVIENPD